MWKYSASFLTLAGVRLTFSMVRSFESILEVLYRIRLRFATFPLENFFRFLSNNACILLELLV